MRKTFKFHIYPTNAQRHILERQLEECRFVYNEVIRLRKNSWEQEKRSLNWYDTNQMLPSMKESRPSLKLVHSQVLQNVMRRVDLAFKAFFRRIKGGEKPGYPRFKGKGRYDSMIYPQYGNGVRLDGKFLVLSKIGNIKIVLHRIVEGRIKTASVLRSRTGKWYVYFVSNIESKTLPESNENVGIDMGLKSFATLSNGEIIENPRFYRQDENDLKRVQKLKDDAKKNQRWDENRRRNKTLAHIHERIRNRRSDFAHKHSRKIVDRYQTIVFEKLAPQKMGKSRGMRKSIMDVAWSQFIGMVVAKAEDAGRQVILVDPRNTSKMCSSCGEIVEKTLADRVHTCPKCGLVMDRDLNAAINILCRGLVT